MAKMMTTITKYDDNDDKKDDNNDNKYDNKV